MMRAGWYYDKSQWHLYLWRNQQLTRVRTTDKPGQRHVVRGPLPHPSDVCLKSMITKDDLLPFLEAFVNMEALDLANDRQVIVNELVANASQSVLCRFIAQLTLDSHAAGRAFWTMLSGHVVRPHVLHWVKVVHSLAFDGNNSTALTDLCDILEAEEKLIATACENIATTARSCRSGETGAWEPSEEGFEAMRENLETTLAMLGAEVPEYDEDFDPDNE